MSPVCRPPRCSLLYAQRDVCSQLGSGMNVRVGAPRAQAGPKLHLTGRHSVNRGSMSHRPRRGISSRAFLPHDATQRALKDEKPRQGTVSTERGGRIPSAGCSRSERDALTRHGRLDAGTGHGRSSLRRHSVYPTVAASCSGRTSSGVSPVGEPGTREVRSPPWAEPAPSRSSAARMRCDVVVGNLTLCKTHPALRGL